MNGSQSQNDFHAWSTVHDLAEQVSFDGTKDPAPYFLTAWGSPKKPNWKPSEEAERVAELSFYGYVYSGEATLYRTVQQSQTDGSVAKVELQSPLIGGMYFACPGACRVEGGAGIVVSVPNATSRRWMSNRPLFSIGGPVEVGAYGSGEGRLPYIDGCTDTLLIHPVVCGAPCLNHLHFPSQIYQTKHTHPSGRVGMVIKGTGRCIAVPSDTNSAATVTPLTPGTVFVIPKDSIHAFETGEDDDLDVIAFHPDSDFGPTPLNHPMLNRTYVDGVSAAEMSEIQTK